MASEMKGAFLSWEKHKQEKRASNREQSAAILTRSGVIFESKNGGAHLIVLAGSKGIDFWPGTGLWIVRGEKNRRRGVRKLLEFVELSRLAV